MYNATSSFVHFCVLFKHNEAALSCNFVHWLLLWHCFVSFNGRQLFFLVFDSQWHNFAPLPLPSSLLVFLMRGFRVCVVIMKALFCGISPLQEKCVRFLDLSRIIVTPGKYYCLFSSFLFSFLSLFFFFFCSCPSPLFIFVKVYVQPLLLFFFSFVMMSCVCVFCLFSACFFF